MTESERDSNISKVEPTTVSKYSEEQVRSAQSIMNNVRTLANVYEEGDHLVVEFKECLFSNDRNQRLRFVRAVADADCVIKGKARLIFFFFYDPDDKQIAQADNVNGVRLK
ncbi:MAG: hypothetical protein LLG04_15965 [Parachlamydia sp.]|nr:hypothetical protein [Parachlamydia sp.]